MINIKVDTKDNVSASLARLIDSIDDPTELNEVGGRSANNAAIEYHEEFNSQNKWRGSNYIGSGANKSGDFGQNVALGWNFKSSDENGATISNNADYYAFKVRGGTITPKRVSHLTIPMISEAVGRRAADYSSYTGNRLFRIAGKKALFEADKDGGVRAVYALVKRAIHRPWPNALPDEDTIAEAFTEGWRNGLADLLESV